MEKTILPIGGFGNRMRAIFSFINTRQEKTNIVWIVDSHCNFKFDSFFEIENKDVFVTDDKNMKHDISTCSKCGIADNHTMYLPLKLKDDIKDEILNNIKNISGIKKSKYIAIHVRRTDAIQGAKQNGVYTSDQDFFDFIDSHDSRYKIYLATDNTDTQVKFKERYSNRIVTYENITKKCAVRHTNGKHTIVDLFTCVYAEHFKGSGWSSYSDLICHLRNTNKKFI